MEARLEAIREVSQIERILARRPPACMGAS